MIRFPDWQERLEVFLHAHADLAFCWGAWDCCLFVCDAIEVITGKDPAIDFRGKYNTPAGAMRSIQKRFGATTVEAVAEGVCRQMELQECLPLQARRGDVVLIPRPLGPSDPEPEGHSLGLVDLTGTKLLVLTEKDGIASLPHSVGVRAWHV